MYIKVEYTNKETGLGTIKGFDCQKYRLIEREDGTFLMFDDTPETYEISQCKVFVMNKDGRTMDRLQ